MDYSSLLTSLLVQAKVIANLLLPYLWPLFIVMLAIWIVPIVIEGVINLVSDKLADFTSEKIDNVWDFWERKKAKRLHGTPVHLLDLSDAHHIRRFKIKKE